jgi:phosphate transport system protein
MRLSFHKEIEALKRDLLKLGVCCSDAIQKAVDALARLDGNLARQVVDGDDVIDNLYLDIEKRCFQLMALQQPMASDMRAIMTVLKICTDLERVGDHATDIAKTVIRLEGEALITELVDIPAMAERVQVMIKEALEAFVAGDAERAARMMRIDDEVDQIYGRAVESVIELIATKPKQAKQAAYLMMCALWLERVGDHVENLGEWTIYMVTGDLREERQV